MKKYRPGRKLTIRGLTNALLRHQYVFLGDKPMHPGFMGGMHFWTLVFQCRIGRIRAAVKNEVKP